MAEEHYLATQQHDDLARMVTELTSEVWILRDRVTTLEQLLERDGMLSRAELDAHKPAGTQAAELDAEREAFVNRVMGAPHHHDYTVDSLIERGHR